MASFRALPNRAISYPYLKKYQQMKKGYISCRTYCVLSHQGFSGIQQLRENDDVSLRYVAASPESEQHAI